MRVVRRTTLACVAACSIAAGVAVSGAIATASPVAHAASAPTVSVAHGSGHTFLVDSNGLALYVFTHDKGDKNSCVKIAGCSAVWPAFGTKGHPTAGKGVSASKLGTIKVGKKLEVTYDGHPLYHYSESDAPGFNSYIGTNEFGGDWDAISPTGKIIK